jgi:hypothetical protein
MRTGTASARRFQRLRWIALSAPIALLAAFHGALLLRRVGDASITRPMVLGRWAFAIALLAVVFIARRFFASSRVVITFWLLVAVLHLAIPAGDRVFNGRENVALLVAALPALIVLSATFLNSRSALWPASMLLHAGPIGFVPLRLDPFHTGRAPPRF